MQGGRISAHFRNFRNFRHSVVGVVGVVGGRGRSVVVTSVPTATLVRAWGVCWGAWEGTQCKQSSASMWTHGTSVEWGSSRIIHSIHVEWVGMRWTG